jgi:hypothetical protein
MQFGHDQSLESAVQEFGQLARGASANFSVVMYDSEALLRAAGGGAGA